MSNKLAWCDINTAYLSYLREHENKIPFKDYGNNSFKPFFNPLFEVDEMVYVSQVTSIKPRHLRMRNNMDFFKVYDNDDLLCVVNLNYMFPVPKEYILEVNYDEIDGLRSFETDEIKQAYIALLTRELREINRMELGQKAHTLYSNKYIYPDDTVSKRCLNFKELEEIGRNFNIL